MTNEERITQVERRLAEAEGQILTQNAIIDDLNKRGKLFHASLTALQSALDAVCAAMDPNYRPQSPKREVM